ncbi:MAG: hypothetical protein AVO34_06795 [Firmicutes bacterium ML8_F2]|jgi:pyruvate formate lyase activating enzyme|nr:MAG: hypothetical protein AVO34_06795 [Firmicutes bacterium ML8_F2]
MEVKDAKISLIDYPGEIACTIFVGNCNLRCGYCYNKDLVLNPGAVPSFPSILDFLQKRTHLIDGICLTGGEPLLQLDVEPFLINIKEMGLKIKLDTNGTYPDILQDLLDKKIPDYIAVDIKAPLEKYEPIVGTRVDLSKIKQTIKIIKNCSIKHEFRTTAAPSLDKDDILQIASLLNTDNYVLQRFQYTPTLIDGSLRSPLIDHQEALKIKKICSDLYGLTIQLRGF